MTELDPKTFDVLAFAQGRNLPEADVEIFTNTAAGLRANQIDTHRSRASGTELDALNEQFEAALNDIKASKLTFRLVGQPLEVMDAIAQKLQDEYEAAQKDTQSEEFVFELESARLAQHIQSVTNAAGEVDTRVWDAENVKSLINALPAESTRTLLQAMEEITFKINYFQLVGTNPDFS